MRPERPRSASRHYVLYSLAAIISLLGIGIAYQFLPQAPIDSSATLILAIVAILSSRFGSQVGEFYCPISWRLPAIATIAVTSGVYWAILIDILAFISTPFRKRNGALTDDLEKETLAAMFGMVLCGLISGYMYALARSWSDSAFVHLSAFVIFYVYLGFVWNYLLSRPKLYAKFQFMPTRRNSELIWQSLLILVLSYVCVFVNRSGLPQLSPMILLPILMVRLVIAEGRRQDEHYYGTIAALSQMLHRAHPYSHRHIERVALIAEEVALRLGLPRKKARLVREAAVLHDIGKLAIDEKILDKPTKLSDEEFQMIRLHPSYGSDIISQVGALRPIAKWVKHHHERLDGSGYPDGLVDVEIPIESKIIAVVDAFDAMTGGFDGSDKRPYKNPLSIEDAIFELERCSGTQFDSRVVRAFRLVIEEGVI